MNDINSSLDCCIKFSETDYKKGSSLSKYGFIERILNGSVLLVGEGNLTFTLSLEPEGAAKKVGFQKPIEFMFKPKDYPLYQHTNTTSGSSAITKYRSFRTWLFKSV